MNKKTANLPIYDKIENCVLFKSDLIIKYWLIGRESALAAKVNAVRRSIFPDKELTIEIH